MIEVAGLCKFYGEARAIEGVTFSIREGEIVGLLGLNGAGKSTILKILSGFLMPTLGEARIGKYTIEHDPQKVKELIGYLPDVPPVYPEMTVLAYLRYVAKLKNVPSGQVDSNIEDVCKKTHLQEVMHHRISELSHGFRQRVGIAQALVHRPKVLILDEPTNGLDPVQLVEMRDLILSLRGSFTVLLSSHILSEITRTCDRILIIDQGQLIAEGSEADLQSSVAQRMRLTCEVRGVKEEGLDKLRQINGVSSVQLYPQGQSDKLVIDTQDDVRSIVAKTIVNDGELLAMERDKAGLESVFMNIISNSQAGARADGRSEKQVQGGADYA